MKKRTKKQFRKRETENEIEVEIQQKPTKTIKNEILGAAFKSSGKVQSIVENTAFRTLETEEIKEIPTEFNTNEYKGIDNYKTYINTRKKQTQSSNGIRQGPLKGLTQIRISSRFDYAAGICKDYKETGYCGFGDNCVFMHDRSDYKQGWELDKEWEEEQKLKRKREEEGLEVEESSESEEELPFACLICRRDFTDPIKTNCMHYFCEKCALKEFKKSPKCFQCGKNTGGVFNVAKELLRKIVEKKERMKQKELELQKKMKEELGSDGE